MYPNQYDGSRPVIHNVARGESLSLIAGKYGFARWQPIWRYNTDVHHVVGPNPDLIIEGKRIFIPRTLEGYHKLIDRLRSLKMQVAGQADQIRYKMEGDYYRHKGQRVLFDLAGNIGTLLGTVALKAAQAAGAAQLAAKSSGNAKVAAQYLADQKTEAFSKFLSGTLKNKAMNGLLTKVDGDLGKAHKDLYLTQKKGINAIRSVSLQGGKSFLDIADILLSYVTVSNVADGLIAAYVGETPGKTYDEAVRALERSTEASQEALDAKIRAYTIESQLVYA